MPFTDEPLGCPQGDTFVFAIGMQANPDGSNPDLTGATAEWILAEADLPGARVFLTKAIGSGLSIGQNNSVWAVTVSLTPADTRSIRPGNFYHECKVTLQNGDVSHVSSGRFVLSTSVNP